MPIFFSCPTCGKEHRVPDSKAGKTGKCKCGVSLQVPPAIGRLRERCDTPPLDMQAVIRADGEKEDPGVDGFLARSKSVLLWTGVLILLGDQ